MTDLGKLILANPKSDVMSVKVDGAKVILAFDYRRKAVQFKVKLEQYAEQNK